MFVLENFIRIHNYLKELKSKIEKLIYKKKFLKQKINDYYSKKE